jgi:hypothetical protein
MQPSPTQDKFPTEYLHTFRIFANDKLADVRIKAAKVTDPFKGTLDKDIVLGDIVYEVTVAPQGFDPTTGAIKDAKALKQRFTFDKGGNALIAGTGELSVYYKKRITIHSAEAVTVKSDKTLDVTAANGATINGGPFLNLRGGVVRLGPGSKPVATQGAMVQVAFPYTPVPIPGSPPLTLFGVIVTGEPTVLS